MNIIENIRIKLTTELRTKLIVFKNRKIIRRYLLTGLKSTFSLVSSTNNIAVMLYSKELVHTTFKSLRNIVLSVACLLQEFYSCI